MIEQREKLYDDIRDNCDVVVDNGVQLEINLNQSQIITLKLAIENYVLTTLESYYGKKFERKNFLVKNRDDILNLPNRTPNGAFYPKVENIEEYNIIQSIVNDILNENDLINQLSSYDVCTVRVVDG